MRSNTANSRPGPIHSIAEVARGRCFAQGLAGLLTSSLLLVLLLVITPGTNSAAAQDLASDEEELVSLDFSEVELPVVIDTISRMTGYNFIYDDRVRGRVTIVSPTEVTIDQAFAVFESVLKVKGFSLVLGPGDTYKVIPIRDVKESSIDTIKDGRPSRNRDRFVTRLVPLRYIDAAGLTQTIKPLISKDASLVAYAATNTIIVTDSESNIRRLLSILDALDVESYRQELAVIKIEFADANTLGEQLSEIYGAEISAASGGATAAQRRSRARSRTSKAAATQTASASGASPAVRILTDERTNSLLILSSRQQLADIRSLVRKLDIPITGGGRIHVNYLRHADAEKLSETINSLLSGAGSRGRGRAGAAGAAAANVQSLRSAVTPLAEGITVTADPATNALVIQASKEAYETLRLVIEKLDVSRPQVLVEALIVEVDVTDNLNLGFDVAFRLVNGDTDLLFTTGSFAIPGAGAGAGLLGAAIRNAISDDPEDAFIPGTPTNGNGSNFGGAIRAAEDNADVNIVSAPHILTSDNEEAEIKIGNNIPIVTGRTDAATGSTAGLASSTNVERQDVGITLRVKPQISEGDTVRLEIYQELTEVAPTLAGDIDNVGVTLTSRKIENTVVVNDGETVVIGGLISESFSDNVSGVPYLMDIPYLGWLFKQKSESLRKINLLVFLTPHIIRNAEDLEQQTILKRLELENSISDNNDFPELVDYEHKTKTSRYSAARELSDHGARYPVERMRELEELREAERADRTRDAEAKSVADMQKYLVVVATFLDEKRATETLTSLIDAGYDGTLISNDMGGQLIFRVEIGPFEDLSEAERTANTLDSAYGYSSIVNAQRRGEP
ncbi:MAG: type II secretion system secretin GspD [Myxococcales bacterium]|nr:type II secretion system protein GspD [Myxococcales bacterium]HIK86519.1 type II secretion system protein GspD [Myxococcales bacterium]